MSTSDKVVKKGKWFQRIITEVGHALAIKIEESLAMVGVDIQQRYQKQIKTHDAVSVGANTGSFGAFFDCDGFDNLAVTVLNDASTSSYVVVKWSNDSVSDHGNEVIIPTSTESQKTKEVGVKARYARIYIRNEDTVAHTMSAWAFLKA